MPWRLAERFETLPCALSEEEIRCLQSLKLATVTLGDLCKTFRGIPAQLDPRV